MSVSKSKCWYSNNYLQFLKCAVPLSFTFFQESKVQTLSTEKASLEKVKNDLNSKVASLEAEKRSLETRVSHLVSIHIKHLSFVAHSDEIISLSAERKG
jgi:hypothetical protein